MYKTLFYMLSLGLMLGSCNTKNDAVQNQEKKPMTKAENMHQLSQAKSMKVLDTDFSKGRLKRTQEINLWDLQTLHGHLCDGLVIGFMAMQQAGNVLYPDGVFDRTNTRVVARSSPCIGDAGMYVSGGRYQFNTFYVSDSIPGLYIVQRIDNGKAVLVNLKPGIKDPEIDRLGALAVQGTLAPCDLDRLKIMEDDLSLFMLENQNPNRLFEVKLLDDFNWSPILVNDFKKTDVLNKNSKTCR